MFGEQWRENTHVPNTDEHWTGFCVLPPDSQLRLWSHDRKTKRLPQQAKANVPANDLVKAFLLTQVLFCKYGKYSLNLHSWGEMWRSDKNVWAQSKQRGKCHSARTGSICCNRTLKKNPQKNLPFGNHGNGLDVRQQIHFGVFVKRQWKRLKRRCVLYSEPWPGWRLNRSHFF